jgi:hypothetical protein
MVENSALIHARLFQTKDKSIRNSLGDSVVRPPRTGLGAVEKKEPLSLSGIEPKIFGSLDRIVLTVQ